jgi:hypothetical protein
MKKVESIYEAVYTSCMPTHKLGSINEQGMRFVYKGKREYWVSEQQYTEFRENLRAYQREYLKKITPEKRREYNQRHADKHRPNREKRGPRGPKLTLEEKRMRRAKRARQRRKEDPLFNLRHYARTRINAALKRRGYTKRSKTSALLGADWSAVRAHIEAQFAEGMSWNNRSEWHIDHIIPLASAGSIEELEKLCHYTNLQPLWAADNLQKGARY